MRGFLKILPWLFVALFVCELVAVLVPKTDGEYHVRDFGRLPVVLNGRVQPFDTLARNALLQIRSTGDLPLEIVPSWKFWHHPKKLKSTEWLLELMTRPEIADTRPAIMIHHKELLGELKLQDKGLEHSGLRYYTFDELKPALPEVGAQAERIMKREEDKTSTPEKRTVFEQQLMKLYNAATLYQRLKVTLQPEGTDDFAQEVAEFRRDLPAAQAAAQANSGKESDNAVIEKIAQPLRDFQMMARFGYALTIPPREPDHQAVVVPHSGGKQGGEWLTVGDALLESARGELHPAVNHFIAMGAAYRRENPGDFNRAIDDYKAWLEPRFPKEAAKGRAEFYFSSLKIFLHATIIDVFAFVLAVFALVTLGVSTPVSSSLRRSAFYLIVLAFLAHTGGLIFRMALEGRPPVTNLYSSAIFIGWGMVVLGIVVELIYKIGLGSVVASFAGFVTLLIAHNLALGGDTMEMMRAVLDNNFWLSTHVVVVTLGYASTFFAGLLAIVFILMGLFSGIVSQPLTLASSDAGGKAKGATQAGSILLGKALSKMIYGVVCFATLFSFVGTVLGGIWADQSWGRFWGWDPKENGALLIVLWNAMILHARWGGLVRERGIVNLAIIGNIVTSFSWFGVNLLGIGLHSYGFTDTGAEYLMNFVGSQLLLLGNGLFPLVFWKSFSQGAPAPGIVRAFLGMLNISWLVTAIIWFIGVYYEKPTAAAAGKIGSIAAIALVWLLAGLAKYITRPRHQMPRAATATAGG